MASSLFKNQNNNIVNMMRAVSEASNPQQMLMNLASKDSQLASVLNEVQQYGGDARELFFQKAKGMGIDPNTILSQLR